MASSREEAEEEARLLFERIHLAPKTAATAASTRKFRLDLTAVIREAGADAQPVSKEQGVLLYNCASQFPEGAREERPRLLREYVMGGKLKNKKQLDAALAYLKAKGAGPADWGALDAAAGVGVTVSEEDIRAAVRRELGAREAELHRLRYHFKLGPVLGALGRELPWADPALTKAVLEGERDAALGPPTEADASGPAPAPEKKPPKARKPEGEPAQNGSAAAPEAGAAPAPAEEADPFSHFVRPEANNQEHTTVTFSDGRRLVVRNTPEQLAGHLRATGGGVVTRFPPEPNGYLHIGHAKACFIDFGYAASRGGRCLLRFDDTNPEAEKQEFIDHIQDIVAWLGWAPWKVTYSSDYFQQLYELAVQLIRSGHAYVDHETPEQVKKSREERRGSPWRDRPMEESLALFEDMRVGNIAEGAATLRLRQDPQNENYNMFDLVAYRVKDAPHPRTGTKWRIYPSYDFTHCTVDALENVTHSLCTLEFEPRRASYFWLLEVLGLYKPVVWEFSRLNITHNHMSKRKLAHLVATGGVAGWDDPRLLTLAGMRRRGVAPEAINAFCRGVGVTRASDGEVTLALLEHHIRAEMDAHAPRCLAVLRPLRLVLTNVPEGHVTSVKADVFPKRTPDTYELPFGRVLYIEREDFREAAARDYFGLAPGKACLLKCGDPFIHLSMPLERYAGVVEYEAHSVGSGGEVEEVRGAFRALGAGEKPPKGVLTWVAEPAPGAPPPTFEARLLGPVFSHPRPWELGSEEWLGQLNPASLVTVRGALCPPLLAAAKPGSRFQLERLGYFCVDPDSRPGALVLNRTVTLRESAGKAGAAAARA